MTTKLGIRQRWLAGIITAFVLCAGAVAAQPAGAAGAATIDRSFGQNGFVTVDLGPGDHEAIDVKRLPDGGFAMAGRHFLDWDHQTWTPFVAWLSSAGAVRHIEPVGVPGTASLFSLVVGSDGTVTGAGFQRDQGQRDHNNVLLVRFRPAGDPDPAFGHAGIVISDLGVSADARAVTLQADRIVVAGFAKPSPTTSSVITARFQRDGQLDHTFGTAGISRTDVPGDDVAGGQALAAQPDGSIIVGIAGQLAVLRLTTNGTLDRTFGVDGIARIETGRQPEGSVTAIAVQTDHGIVAAAGLGGGVVRFTNTGQPDGSFGEAGRVELRPDSSPTSVDIMAGGDLLVGGGTGSLVLTRIHPDGRLDDSFASDGQLSVQEGSLTRNWNGAVLQADGQTLIWGHAQLPHTNTLAIQLSRIVTTPVPDQQAAVRPSPQLPETIHPATVQPRGGYWALASDGHVYNFGAAASLGSGRSGAVDLEPTPSGQGYWILNLDGIVSGFGDAKALGNVDPSTLAQGEAPASLSATPSGKGYWIFTNRGRALPFGDAQFLGDMSKTKLNGPVLGSVATPTGRGYYMVASDGGIFAFGDAAFAGSMGGRKLNAAVQSLVPDGDGSGYWLVASDGGIFAFDAPFRGSMGATKLNKPVVGMVRYGDGYLMVGADGGIFNFSTAPFAGSLGDKPPASPVVAVAALPNPGEAS